MDFLFGCLNVLGLVVDVHPGDHVSNMILEM